MRVPTGTFSGPLACIAMLIMFNKYKYRHSTKSNIEETCREIYVSFSMNAQDWGQMIAKIEKRCIFAA